MGQSIYNIIKRISAFFNYKRKPWKESLISKYSFDDFQIIKSIAYGSQGEVYKVKHILTDKEYAMKIIIRKDAKKIDQLKSIKTELKILKQMNSPYILKLNWFVEDNEKIGFITDLMQQDLKMILNNQRKFSEDQVISYTAEIIIALQYLHEQNYIYRFILRLFRIDNIQQKQQFYKFFQKAKLDIVDTQDLKPENILIGFDGHIKITDFGITRKISQDDQTTFSGTKEYCAPEVLLAKNFDMTVDWWSLGILIFEMLTGKNPFCIYNLKTQNFQYEYELMFQNIINSKINDELYTLSENAQNIIKQLLQINPQKRLGCINDAKEVKQHAFYQKINWDQKQKYLYIPFIPENTLEQSQTSTPLEIYDGFSFDNEQIY